MMRVSDISALAVDGAGRLFIAAGGLLGVVADGGVVEIDGAPKSANVVAIAGRREGGVYAVDASESRIVVVDPDGQRRAFAGAPQPRVLDVRRRRVDGNVAEALLLAPALVAASPHRVFVVEGGSPRSVRAIENDLVSTLEIPESAIRTLTAVAVAPDGTLVLADGTTPVPCVYALDRDGRFEALAGGLEAGSRDGARKDARFARIVGLAGDPDGIVVADGVRLRRVGVDGHVKTIEGAPRFWAIGAIAAGPSGEIYVADVGDGALWRVEPDGAATVIARDVAARPEIADPRATALAFGAAVVDDDAVGAWALAEALLAEHARTGASRPDRGLHPISVASSRVGRELALAWTSTADPRRARLGAYCLWLIRNDERLAAPVSDVERLVGAAVDTLVVERLHRARLALNLVEIAFGRLERRRDRIAVAETYRHTDLARAASDLFASPDAVARDLAACAVEQARDIRFTPALAALALGGSTTASKALLAIWESPAYTESQAAELRDGLRFGRATVDRFLDSLGAEAALGPRGAARFRRATERR